MKIHRLDRKITNVLMQMTVLSLARTLVEKVRELLDLVFAIVMRLTMSTKCVQFPAVMIPQLCR